MSKEPSNQLIRSGWRTQLRRAWAGKGAEALREALWLFVTLRVVLSLFALLASVLFRLPRPCAWEGGPLLHATGLDFHLLGVWRRWDACWYAQIATLGYRQGDPSVVFFPLYPALMRAVSIPFGGNLALAGLIVSGGAYVAAMTGLYQLVRTDFDTDTARRTILYLSVFPSAFFLFAPFSEALFLALAVWTLYATRRGVWQVALPLAFLVGLTRTQGCLLALPLAWEWWRRRQAASPSRRSMLPEASVVLLPPLGFLLFVAYSAIFTGWTTFQAQRNWGLAARAPWTAVTLSWRHIRARGDVIEAINLALLILFAALLVTGLRRLPLSYTLYVAPQLVLIGTRVNFLSPLLATSRYVLVLFPAFVLLALGGRNHRLHTAWLIASTMLLAFLLYAFLSGPFVA